MIKLSQRQINLVVSIYIGIVLNAITLYRHASSAGMNEIFVVIFSSLAIFTLTYGICSIFSFFGKLFYKLLIIFLIFASATASYYMIFFMSLLVMA